MRYAKHQNTEKLYNKNRSEKGFSNLSGVLHKKRPDFGQGVSVCYIGFPILSFIPNRKKRYSPASNDRQANPLLGLTEYYKRKITWDKTRPALKSRSIKALNWILYLQSLGCPRRLGHTRIARANKNEFFLSFKRFFWFLIKIIRIRSGKTSKVIYPRIRVSG